MTKILKLIVLLVIVVIVAAFAIVAAVAPSVLPAGLGIQSVPLRAKYSKSLVGKGVVVTISNGTNKTLKDVKVRCYDPKKAGSEKVFEIAEFKPDQELAIGWVEGWQFEAGHKVKVSARGYLSRTWEVTKDGLK